MAIEFQCHNCRKQFRVKHEFQGQRRKCPSCGQVLKVPRVKDRPQAKVSRVSVIAEAEPKLDIPGPSLSEQERLQQLQEKFQESIPRVRTGFFYQIGLLIVATFVLLLPLVYLGLIGLTGWAVYYHAVEHTGIVRVAGGGRAAFFMLLAYITPIFCGVVLIFFMLKPLFARRVKDERRRTLTRQGQPVLFEFVDKICESVRAPKPKRIDVVFDVNAAASFRRGFLSFFSSDLVLTVGLPLVAGVTEQQFAGILAHEFGHFTQHLAMRLGWCINKVNSWFERVVYERDAFDYWLSESVEEHESILSLLFLMAVLCVSLTRLILFVLMMVSHAMSCMLSREMEYNADQHEARLVGSETFKKTCRRLPNLMVAFQQAIIAVAEGDLRVGQVPKYVGNYVKNMTKEDKKEVRKLVKKQQSGWFDTHPTDDKRIEKASHPQHPGLIQLDGPATGLFRNFDQICESAAKG